MRVELLVVGLGNPGRAYSHTRHNAGRWAVDELLKRHDVRLNRRRRLQASTAELTLGERLVVISTPSTYMNQSGRAVAKLISAYKLESLEHLMILHDELDLQVGSVKVKIGGGMAGHRGLKSIRDHLRVSGFARVRIGIGHPKRPYGSNRESSPDRRSQTVLTRAIADTCNTIDRPVSPATEPHTEANCLSGESRELIQDRFVETKGGVAEYVLSQPDEAELPELRKAVVKAADAVEHLVHNDLQSTMNSFNVTQ